jgi:alpha-tubulin suppressor-like RCC1 family protein
MAIISRLAVAASRAWGQFSSSAQVLANFLYMWGLASSTNSGRLGNFSVATNASTSSPVQITANKFNNFSRDTTSGSAGGIDAAGRLWMWGFGTNGVLGDGTTAAKSYQTQIGTLTNWSKLNVCDGYCLAVKTDGSLWAWGYNINGELGDGTTINKSSPIQIGTLTNWSSVTSSTNSSAAIKTDGTLWTWGRGNNGELGDGTSVSKSSPVQVGTLSNWSVVKGTNVAFFALKTDGTLWAWGNGATGRLGDGTTINKSSPIQIGTLTDWATIGSHSVGGYAVKQDGTFWSWGRNNEGQLGNGTTVNTSSPIQVGTLTDWRTVDGSISSGDAQYVHAIKQDGTLWAWGEGGSVGNLGNGSTLPQSSPVQIGTLTNWNAVYSGAFASDTSSYLWIWGNGAELGRTRTTFETPTIVGRSFTAVSVASVNGAGTTSAVDSAGKLWGWGNNASYTIGDGTSIQQSAPIQIGTQTNWASVSTPGDNVVSAIKTDDTQYTWGLVDDGNTGSGFVTALSTWLTPLNPYTNNTYSKIALGNQITALIDTSGRMYVAANGSSGSNGIGSTVSTANSPVQINSDTDWAEISVGNIFGVVTKNNGTLWGWGSAGAQAFGDVASFAAGATVTAPTLTNQGSGYTKTVSKSNGRDNFAAIDSQGRLWMWGQGGEKLTISISGGNSAAANQEMTLSTDWDAVYNSDSAFIAKKSNGSLWAWGTGAVRGLGAGVLANFSPAQIGTLTTWADVSVSNNHALATKNDGTLWAWGINAFGQLGDGTTTTRSSPVQIGTLTDWGNIWAGIAYSVAVKTNGTLWAWGLNDQGQLGNGSTTDRSSPVQIGTLTNWSKVSAGQYTTLAVKTNGTLWGWGLNANGQIGNGTLVSTSSPVQVGALTTWSKVIASGARSSYAIKNDGTLWSWGYNILGQLGLGDTTDRSSPVQVGTLTTWSDVSCNTDSAVLGITTDNKLYFWGDNAGAIGGRAQPNLYWPTKIGTLTNWSKIKASTSNVIAIKTDGSLWTWGANAQGQIGDSTTVAKNSPVQIGTLTNWTNVSGANNASYAIKNDNTIWAWGLNQYGKLGLGDTLNKSSPIQIGTLTGWQSFSNLGMGSDTIHVLKSDGTLWGWGRNNNGMLGDGSTIDKSSPVQIGTLTNWAAMANDYFDSMFVDTSGVVYQTGYGAATATLANGGVANVSSPVQVATGYGTTLSAAGTGTAANGAIMLLKTGGKAYAWGLHSSVTPMAVSQAVITSPTQLEETGWASQFVKNDGSLWMWGLNASGQLGTGNTLARYFPQQIGTLTNWSKVSKFNNHTVAVKSDGSLWSWGIGTSGCLGSGATTSRSSPVQVGTLTNWGVPSVGTNFSVAVKTDGTLWSWGRNNEGQLGDGTTTNKSSPVQIGTLTTWIAAEATSDSVLAVKNDGTLWAWGNGQNGRLGDGTTVSKSSPVQIGTQLSWGELVDGANNACAGAMTK